MSSNLHRLKEKEIKEVFKKGTTWRGKFLVLKIKKSNFVFSRWAFIVSTKVFKKAVARNRLRRLLRESLRGKIEAIKGGFDGIILALPNALEKNYREIDKEIEKLLRFANIYQKSKTKNQKPKIKVV